MGNAATSKKGDSAENGKNAQLRSIILSRPKVTRPWLAFEPLSQMLLSLYLNEIIS